MSKTHENSDKYSNEYEYKQLITINNKIKRNINLNNRLTLEKNFQYNIRCISITSYNKGYKLMVGLVELTQQYHVGQTLTSTTNVNNFQCDNNDIVMLTVTRSGTSLNFKHFREALQPIKAILGRLIRELPRQTVILSKQTQTHD